MTNGVGFELIRDAVDHPDFRGRVCTNIDEVLTERGVKEPDEREEIKRVIAGLLSAPVQCASATVDMLEDLERSTLKTADSFKLGLSNTVKQIEQGFQATMVMYMVAFYLGIGLIAAATAMAFMNHTALLPIVFGTLGMADILAYFITKPPQDLQFSRARLAQLQAAFYNWFMDYTSWNGQLAMLAKQGQANVFLMKTVSTTLMDHTEKTMSLIDTYCATGHKREKGKADQ
jgi:hypothetical protein